MIDDTTDLSEEGFLVTLEAKRGNKVFVARNAILDGKEAADLLIATLRSRPKEFASDVHYCMTFDSVERWSEIKKEGVEVEVMHVSRLATITRALGAGWKIEALDEALQKVLQVHVDAVNNEGLVDDTPPTQTVTPDDITSTFEGGL